MIVVVVLSTMQCEEVESPQDEVCVGVMSIES